MFGLCRRIKKLDLSNFNTNEVTNMSEMFMYCNGLEELNITSFNTSNVSFMNDMFNTCNSLTSLDLQNFDTSKVINMANMFSGCTALSTLDLSSFNTSKVTNMYEMFNSYNVSRIRNIYVSDSWNTEAVTSSTRMMNGCRNLPNYNSEIVDKTNAHYNEGGYLTLKTN